MADEKTVSFGNSNLVLLTVVNTLITIVLTSSINFYFQKQNLRDEKLINYRIGKIESYSASIVECNRLMELAEKLISQIKPEDAVTTKNGGHFTRSEGTDRTGQIIDTLNSLSSFAFKLPYQMRLVIVHANAHFGTLFNNKLVPEHLQKMNKKTENLTAASFSLALEIAKEDYIAFGEPHHKVLADLQNDN